MKSAYISRVTIKNYRNFLNVDVNLHHKQVVIGENNVGKTNFIRALQLLLDPSLSDEDRYLSETDFYDGLKAPMEKGEEIEISIEIQGFEHNKGLRANFDDALISVNPAILKFTYKYFPVKQEDGSNRYEYVIYQGFKQEVQFTHKDRKMLNLRVINAVRDVEAEMRNQKKSPINKLIKTYNINKTILEQIASNIKRESNQILGLDEIMDLTRKINKRFEDLSGIQPESKISLETFDVDTNRLLNTMKIMIGEIQKRPTNEVSLGLNNILYISLLMLFLEDKTIPTFVENDKFKQLIGLSDAKIVERSYELTDNGNYSLKENLDNGTLLSLYSFMEDNNPSYEGVTILVIEEPEAHIHPTLQRIIYKDVVNGDNSVLLTTHSTHIASVAPINSIVHLHRTRSGTRVSSATDLKLSEGDIRDLERYIDASRGEIYFGKGVILVEGIAEEYLLPKFAELLKKDLDRKGIIICNINSTNFKPYMKLLNELHIPYVVVTDGDYYKVETVDGKEKRFYHEEFNSDVQYGFLGHELLLSTLVDLEVIDPPNIPNDYEEQEQLLVKHNIYLGFYTLEVDIMDTSEGKKEAQNMLCLAFNEVTSGGTIQKDNFRKELSTGAYWKCLAKIEGNGIGKGRFAQRLSNICVLENIPQYICDAIDRIFKRIEV